MPIHRHPALAPLSRDHHLALQLAAAVRARGSTHLRARLPRDMRALAEYVRGVFRDEIEPHFQVEERQLMVAIDGLDPSVDTLCADLRRDHDMMRALIRDLDGAIDDAAIAALLDRFGERLEAHVRAEERTLFARTQQLLDARTLDRMAPRLTRHMVVHDTLAR